MTGRMPKRRAVRPPRESPHSKRGPTLVRDVRLMLEDPAHRDQVLLEYIGASAGLARFFTPVRVVVFSDDHDLSLRKTRCDFLCRADPVKSRHFDVHQDPIRFMGRISLNSL